MLYLIFTSPPFLPRMITKKVTILALILALGNAKDCFYYDTNFQGTSLNNGLEQMTDSAEDCQKLCKYVSGCEAFTWASSQYHDPNLRNTCWLKKDVISQSYSKNAVSGPRNCEVDPTEPPTPGNCCQNINFGSTGNLVGSDQAHVLGDYKRSYDGAGGRWIYEQVSGRNYLWYYPQVGAWFIGEFVGTNIGSAIGYGDANCPENLPFTWVWWSYSEEDWIKDEEAKFSCR